MRSPSSGAHSRDPWASLRNDRAGEETSVMTSPIAGGVDCDLHPAVPHLTSLLPYLNDYWRDQVTTRGMTDLVSQSYPPHSPLSSRPDWRPAQGKPGSSLADMKAQAARSIRCQLRHLQSAVRRADGVF